MPTKDAVGLGALNVDLIFEVDDLSQLRVRGKKLEAGGEVFGTLKDFQGLLSQLEKDGRLRSRSPGGSAANTMVALSRMGFETGYIGKVGRDKEGEFILQSMEGVDTSRVLKNDKSGMTAVLLDKAKERTILVLPNSNDALTFDEIDLPSAKNARFLHLTSFAGDSPTEAQKELVKRVHNDVKISFDPGEIHTQKGLAKMLPVLKRSYIVFVTDRETQLLTGEDYMDGTRELLNYGASIVVCKLGARGSYVLTREEEFHVPPVKTKAVDKTGAGDVYAAGFLAGLLRNEHIMKCGLLATRAAAQSIKGWGREKYPDRSFLEEGV
ncbi:MAG: carbohydrate kinase family protein [Actinomycetota bacterium]